MIFDPQKRTADPQNEDSMTPTRQVALNICRRLTIMLTVTLLLAACASPSLRDEIIRYDPSYAKVPATKGVLAEMADEIFIAHGTDHSGFRLLDNSFDALNWRLALIDSATSSIDIQTYLWYPDNSGKLVMQRSVQAAERGVYVRMIIDDLVTAGLDQQIYELNQHPNIEIMLFNPWQDRSLASRAGEMIIEMERLNTRMHDKLVIVDGNAAIVGGRNIGDHYFGINPDYNFHDLDLLGFGAIARQANTMFDSFWNSDWVVSAVNIDTQTDPEAVKETWQQIINSNLEAEELSSFAIQPRDWSDELAAIKPELHYGTSEIAFDSAETEEVDQVMIGEMFNFQNKAQKELLITNAYIIPGPKAITFLQGLTDRGVDIRILTNSLESHDVPAVNSHYKGWRDDLINAGAELYELRADAAIKSTVVEVPPVVAEFTGLHTKAMVIDREQVFIGSMNLDPRSAHINTEAGAFVKSPGLAQELADVMLRNMQPENAWQVLLDDDGDPYWVNSDTTVTEQPARDGSQRVMDAIFMMFPKDQY